MDRETAPNARLQVQVPVRRRDRWEWRPLPALPDAYDWINSETQLLRALMTYSTMAARLLLGHPGQRFRVLVRNVPGRILMGHYEWMRSGESGRLVPASEPWTNWPEATCLAA